MSSEICFQTKCSMTSEAGACMCVTCHTCSRPRSTSAHQSLLHSGAHGVHTHTRPHMLTLRLYHTISHTRETRRQLFSSDVDSDSACSQDDSLFIIQGTIPQLSHILSPLRMVFLNTSHLQSFLQTVFSFSTGTSIWRLLQFLYLV